ncbi:glycosyltransferase family 4 protein [Candidatus Peregrinibacteria bacterium]|nr:glycosyltransferase family 4 protein [Candidatus Peregrinibacteria bacterium]
MKKKVVILSAFLTPFRSGAEACAEEVPLILSEEYDFVIITSRMRRSLPKRDMLQGKIPVIRVGIGIARVDKWLYPFLASLEARKHKPDIVHAILETFAGLGLLLCKFTVPSAKRILTCQTTNRSFFKGTIVRSAETVTAISNHLADIVRKLGRGDVVIIPNGIHVKQFAEATRTYTKVPGRILSVGRLEKMKGVDLLLKAFAKLNDSSATLRIVGNGTQRAVLTALAKELGIHDRTTFVGHVPPADLYREYAEADVFCGFSRSEALGNVFIEAMAAECVVLASDIGGIKEIVPQESRITLDSSPEIVASRLQECFMKDESARSTIRQSMMHNFNWSVIAPQYAALYDRLLSRTSAAA